MTIEQGKHIISDYYEKKFKKINRFSFFTGRGRKVFLTYTRILNAWEKDANLPLPDQIDLSDENITFIIDNKGLLLNNGLVVWRDVLVAAIARHRYRIPSNRYLNEYYIVACINTGDIIERRITYDEKYSKLFVHFIELYKNGNVGQGYI